jgi:hypothetical protein
MSATTNATDWHVNALAQIAGGCGPGAGIFAFIFKSQSAGVEAQFVFGGAGLGAGLKQSSSIATGSLSPTSFSRIRCDMPFSANDLNGAGGRLTQLGLSVTVGYSWVYISAWTSEGTLFHSQSAHGWSGGVAMSGVVLHGVWGKIG